MIEYEHNRYFLAVLGVKQERCDQGLGGALLGEIIRNPGAFCKNPIPELNSGAASQITTVSRGEAAGFYQKYGFEPCDFAEIPEPYREQCRDCPEKENCKPVPMRFMIGFGKE